MNKIIKLNDPSSDTYVSSDWHLYHNPSWDEPLWMKRGYSSVQEMNDDIRDKINARCRPQDTLIHAGDIGLNCSPEQLSEFLDSLNVNTIYHIWGNHSGPDYSLYKNKMKEYDLPPEIKEVYPLRFKNLVFVGGTQEFTIRKKRVVASHFPYEVFNKSHHGAWHISGHSHYSNPNTQAEAQSGKRLDVGWEGKNDIYSFSELEAIMNSKEIKQWDHHDENTN